LAQAYKHPAKYIIPTAGPIWNGGSENKDDLLGSCYVGSLKIAENYNNIASIAFPYISTGNFSFPPDRAATIAVDACKEMVLDTVFCCFSEGDPKRYLASIRA